MTIDEAIKHCLEVAEQNETQADKIGRQLIGSAIDKYATDCRECAADHRQLAEWLTELKDLKNSIGAVRLNNMTEALKLMRAYKAENIAQKKLIAEYKRLLKAALGPITKALPELCTCEDCALYNYETGDCEDRANSCSDVCKWRYADEALKLIGGN